MFYRRNKNRCLKETENEQEEQNMTEVRKHNVWVSSLRMAFQGQ